MEIGRGRGGRGGQRSVIIYEFCLHMFHSFPVLMLYFFRLILVADKGSGTRDLGVHSGDEARVNFD